MEFLKILSLRGPNIWTYRPVLEVWLDIGVLEDSPSNTIPGFYERLTAWLPTLIEHRCGIGERGGFLQRLREGTWPGHILEHVTLELQNLAGMQSGFGKARETSVRGVYKVVVRSRNEAVTRAALAAARDLILAAMQDKPFEVAPVVAKLNDMVDSLCLGPSTACIVDAASDRGIPSIRLTEGNLVQLGYGVSQHRIWTAETDQTSAIAESISRDKDLTKTLLSACGVPVPEGRIVDNPADAWEAAEDIGLPVVVKPTDGNHGRGVSTELMTQEEVEAAFVLADAQGSEVIVERYIRGNEHRLLVVGGRLAAAARGETVSLVADGKSTIRSLIAEQINTDPRRGEAEEFPMDRVEIDTDAAAQFELKRQGYAADSVPEAGTEVLIQRNGNVAFDVTDLVHPEVAATVSLAARIVGLDIAGIDLVAEDISRPLAEQGGAIVEINAGPGLLMHLKPASGEPRPVGRAIVDSLFTAEETGRIPVVGICGTQGKAQVARIVTRLLKLAGYYVGLASRDGLSFDKRIVDKRDSSNWSSAQKVLLNRSVNAAVIENSIETILSEGLGYDRCQVGIITNLEPAKHFGAYYIETAEQVCNVVRTQIDVVLSNGVAVLNGADPLVAAMADYCDGEVIYFAREGELPAVTEHLQAGGRAVLVRGDKIVFCTGSDEVLLLTLCAVPMSADECNLSQLENVLAAVAAAWALGVSPSLIRAGIASFEVAEISAR
ncbi:cyanophycin synthetase [Gallionella capsiferriformans]|jgi:cyanophycin synthetase|uniref:Cyanophycin synthetase n=1 Tax=Gallionella capsiferriformans (strain ES-2) TaxID=395494 RepID=D9SGH6_GALCS|nr:cyanophycin synthetase [Gallionella capsiferriformans]ADL55623.1 cyanophycin synthetase [Gallionella capsiferriformans ES-2]